MKQAEYHLQRGFTDQISGLIDSKKAVNGIRQGNPGRNMAGLPSVAGLPAGGYCRTESAGATAYLDTNASSQVEVDRRFTLRCLVLAGQRRKQFCSFQRKPTRNTDFVNSQNRAAKLISVMGTAKVVENSNKEQMAQDMLGFLFQ